MRDSLSSNRKQQLNDINELKKLAVINKIIKIFNDVKDLHNSLPLVCNAIPHAFQYPEYLTVQIVFDNKKYHTTNFKETQWQEKHVFETPDKKKGAIELFYERKYIEKEKKDYLFKDLGFLENLSSIISGAISKHQLEKLLYDNTERLKELKGINRTAQILKNSVTIEESLQDICDFLPEAWQYPQYTVARIIYEDKVFTGNKYKETKWVQSQSFETPGNKKGVIEIYYLKKFPQADEGPFLKEERDLIDNLAALISGMASKSGLKELLIKNTERLKELRGINQTSEILKNSSDLKESLQIICSILPDAWQYPEYTSARIKYDGQEFISKKFKDSKWVQKQVFEAPGKKKGLIEIFYLKEFPEEYEGPFLKEERNLLINLANLISGSATKTIVNKLQYENRERLKELWAINQTSQIIAKFEPIEITLQKICSILPKSWQYPKYTVVRIKYEGQVFTSKNFIETSWSQKENFVTIDNKKGSIEIFYTKEFPDIYEGPFLKEERHLIINIGKLISGYLNDSKGRDMYRKNLLKEKQTYTPDQFRKSLIKDKQPLQLFFNQQVLDKYIYLDMMKYKVKEILFVSTLYDAFILEKEDGFFEQFMGEIYQYSLFSLPRITGVSSAEETIEILDKKTFDLVIVMVGIDKKTPLALSEKIKQTNPDIPVYLLINQKENINFFEEMIPSIKTIDKMFVWNGDSQILFAIVKSIEDKTNVENDTKIGLVRVILLIENSALYYSKYLQILYSIVFGQVQQLLPEVERNELDKISKMRSRPKILLARNYEDALYTYNKYKDFLLCIISDVEFEKEGKTDKNAGTKFIKYVKSQSLNVPIILQSSDIGNEKIAKNLNVKFLNKNSDNLLGDLKKYLTYYLGFGDFIFRDKDGIEIATAKTLREFETLLTVIPDESFHIHASKNQFSIWLMARGEIQLAKLLNPIRSTDFTTIKESREYILNIIRTYQENKIKGKVLNFDDTCKLDEKNIVTFSGGSLGGKGRGLSFINSLIYNLDFSSYSKEINIRNPITAIIGTDEFEYYIEKNGLYNRAIKATIPYNELKQYFINADLSEKVINNLKVFIDQIKNPIAIRSSSISEDSLNQPFAGVFDTYILPNSNENKKIRLEELMTAIKLVYSSVFSDKAKKYFRAINHKVEDEKMAVVLQKLVGTQYDDYYYPHISGVAQSYNFYPIASMKPEEGYAMTAIGLGSYVVEGWKSYRFSPKYPKIDIFTTKDLINNSQLKFYAVDCSKRKIDYLKNGELAALTLLEISEAEKHGTLIHCASVYDYVNDRIEIGVHGTGPRIINFGEILKHDYIPLAETLKIILNTIKEAMGCPVEIEFAVDLNKTKNNLPSFYLLQIKPMVASIINNEINIEEFDKSQMLIYTQSSLGNGKIDNIYDIIYIDNNKFDKLKTIEMAREVEFLNNKMFEENRQYILIGPGRWGTRDQFLGIPVIWSQISNAKVIIEISLANFPLDSSLGSHFFHNITSMNVGYFSVLDSSITDFIKWDLLNSQKIENQTKYLKHIRFNSPLSVVMNGNKKTSAIIYKK